ncbi:hypothetical protein ABEB36_007534 [Hypothenemus hampei]|uniref:Uncharacterized protein n=1 Tax=Hypothenemus hampei TaxID=57062 RepID=A0ABD1EUB2_HYPHA
MQTKLPVTVKKKQFVQANKTQCCCSQLLKIIIDNLSNCNSSIKEEKGFRYFSRKNKKNQSKCTQTSSYEFYIQLDHKLYHEIKDLLITINASLDEILHALQGKKQYLYKKLQDEVLMQQGKNVTTRYIGEKQSAKNNKKTDSLDKQCTNSHIGPKISRQPLWCKQQTQNNLGSAISNILVCPRHISWMSVGCNRPFSCSDINYFRPFGMTLPSNIRLIREVGDFQINKNNMIEEDSLYEQVKD